MKETPSREFGPRARHRRTVLAVVAIVLGVLGRGADAEEALERSTLEVRVSDHASGYAVPCRVTIVDDRGVLAPVHARPAPHLAVRAGVAYTTTGRVRLGVRPGRYTLYATRGFEYSLATKTVTADEGKDQVVYLTIHREVPTDDWVACDPHVHTFTYSGHGDATLDERLVTLAGEGIVLPVATDHDHLTDYAEPVRKLDLKSVLTPVVGDEVTTRRGHFNAFPFAPTDPVPDSTIEDWPTLFQAIRRGASERVIVLNHPRDLHAGFRPFGPENFNAATGELRSGVGFDAVEVVNSGALQSDPMRVVRDWFALWNHGQQVTAVGSSDSHDVSRSIVGQGRTYLRGDAEDIGAACQALRAGRALVSLGLLTRLTVNDKYQSGDLATGLGDTLRVTITVSGPSWTTADRVELFANGIPTRAQRIEAQPGAVVKARVEWSLPRPRHDVALVAVASGPGVTAPYWAFQRPFQPTSKDWEPRVFGLANPVRIDADGDGAWSSPRYYAQLLIELMGTEPTKLVQALAGYDEAVATQAAAFCHASGREGPDPALARALSTAPEAVRRGFAAFEESLPGRGTSR